VKHPQQHGGHSSGRHNNSGRGGHGRGQGREVGRGHNNDQIDHLKNITCYNCDKKDTVPRTARHPRKMEMKTQTWFKKQISKICFNPRLRECLPKG
jgi:hypothetical protein